MSALYGCLQWLAYRLAIINAHPDLPLIFYLLHIPNTGEMCTQRKDMNDQEAGMLAEEGE